MEIVLQCVWSVWQQKVFKNEENRFLPVYLLLHRHLCCFSSKIQLDFVVSFYCIATYSANAAFERFE